MNELEILKAANKREAYLISRLEESEIERMKLQNKINNSLTHIQILMQNRAKKFKEIENVPNAILVYYDALREVERTLE